MKTSYDKLWLIEALHVTEYCPSNSLGDIGNWQGELQWPQRSK